MAVIKANAYGHGMLEVAKALGEADSLAVARLSEALSLRAAGVDTTIVILEGVTDAEDIDAVVDSGCVLVVHCAEQLQLLEQRTAGNIDVWLKFDTGMNRLGFDTTDADGIIARARECACVGTLGLMSHLANADECEDETTHEQMTRFEKICDGFEGDISIANSPGLLAWPNTIRQAGNSGNVWIRPGIALYGISPFRGKCGAELGLLPVMQFESRLIAVKKVRAGERVGYGGTWQAGEDTLIGIASVGYGDGYSRFLPSGTPVLVNDRRVLLAGRVSMDMIAVDLGSDATEKIGDHVLLWGDGLPVEEIAECAGTIPYQLVTGILNREPPEFIGSPPGFPI
jgi:alanine racemase